MELPGRERSFPISSLWRWYNTRDKRTDTGRLSPPLRIASRGQSSINVRYQVVLGK